MRLKKTKLCLLIAAIATISVSAQKTIEFKINAIPNANGNTFNGNIIIHNNTPTTIPGGYQFSMKWKWLNTFDWGLTATTVQGGLCDEWDFETQSWQSIPAFGSTQIAVGGTYGDLFSLPAYAIDSNGDTLWTVASNGDFTPKSYNTGPQEYYLNGTKLLRYGTNPLRIGEAQVYQWQSQLDVYIPDNKAKYAIAAAHSAAIVNNYVGFEMVEPNLYMARALAESNCGCENDIVNDPVADDPITFQASTVSGGCFQILPIGWAALESFYPTTYSTLNYASTISGNNFVKSCVSSAFYDVSALNFLEKTECIRPTDFVENVADKYYGEQLLSYLFHEGLSGTLGMNRHVMDTNRATYLTSNKVFEDAVGNGISGSGIDYSRQIRNSMMQLGDDVGYVGGLSNLGTNWFDITKYQWRGWYDDNISWSVIEDYIDEVAAIFPNADVTAIKTATQTVFNSINSGAPVPFSFLGEVIDEMVLQFPSYNPDYGFGLNYFASTCEDHSETRLTYCTDAGGVTELKVDCYGKAPFSFEIQDENNNVLYKVVNSYVAAHVVQVPTPSQKKGDQVMGIGNSTIYTVEGFEDHSGARRVNTHLNVVSFGDDVVTNVDQSIITDLSSVVAVYPNPISKGNLLNIEFKELGENRIVKIYNVLQQEVKSFTLPAQNLTNQIDFSRYTNGVYFVQILENGSVIDSKKVIKK